MGEAVDLIITAIGVPVVILLISVALAFIDPEDPEDSYKKFL